MKKMYSNWKHWNLGTLLLWIVLALIAGWSFIKMMEPANLLNLLQSFTLC